jgi:hypothetical protein
MKQFLLSLLCIFAITIQAQYWQRAYDNNGNTDLMSKIIETANHHFVIAASSTVPAHYGYGFDGYVIATDFNGDTLWTKTIGSMNIGAQNDFLNDVIEDQDHNLVFTGITKQGLQENKLWFAKFQLNASGTQVSSITEKKYGASNSGGAKIIQNPDGTYFVVGYTTSMGTQQGGSDVWLVKLNNNGDTLWTRTYDFGHRDEGVGIIPFAAGNYLLIANLYTGQISTPVPYYTNDAAYFVVDANGNVLKTMIFDVDTINRFHSVKRTSDGGAIIIGVTSRYENHMGAGDVYIVKLNANADTVWTKTYGSYGKYDGGLDIMEANDGTYYACGFTQTQFVDSVDNWWLLRLNAFGDTMYTKCLIHKKDNDDPASILQASDGSIVVAGWINANSNPLQGLNMGNSDIYVAKLDTNFYSYIPSISNKLDINIYPNPANDYIYLHSIKPLNEAALKIYNMWGIKVIHINNINGNSFLFDTHNLPNGVYLIEVFDKSCKLSSKKITILKP